ncbi:MAG: amino acid permease [Candidatus Obscuribacterales bacterium]|nr:amino acid permease [Candidatus Obscuribacterales bacterium]
MQESVPEPKALQPHDTELGKLGYAQELFRTMGGFSNFAIGFSVVSILTGAVTLYDYGLRMGGPAEMTIGWPIVVFFTTFVVLSMAELASSLPTSGATYHWSCELGGKGWGWFTAWFIIVGYITALAGIDYGCAQFLMPMLGIPATQTNLLMTYAALLVSHGVINQCGIRLVSWLNDFSVTVHIVGLIVIIGALLLFAPKQDFNFLLSAKTYNADKIPYGWAFILGLLQAQWTLSGYDSCASVSEETVDANLSAPWGMVIAVIVSSIVGYIMLLALTLSIGDVNSVLSATDGSGNSVPAVVAILVQSLGKQVGVAVSVLTAMAMWFCGLGAVTGCSRVIYAFARDGGLPFSDFFKKVESKHHVPIAAIWATVACAFLAAIYSGAYAVVTSISTISLYFAYTTPVFLSWRGRHVTPLVKGPWHLGKFSHGVNLLAIIWTVFISAVISLANDGRAGKAMAGLLVSLGLWYYFRERHRFKGPSWIGKGLAS